MPGYCVSESGVVVRDGSVLRQHLNIDSYPIVCVTINGVRSRPTVHKLVLEAFRGPRPKGKEARHLDGDRFNNHISNLEWSSHKDNIRDKYRHGTMTRGSAVYGSKLDTSDVKSIVKALKTKTTLISIARRFGVTYQCICNIRDGKAWSWLTGFKGKPV